jgi:hypothetical protein
MTIPKPHANPLFRAGLGEVDLAAVHAPMIHARKLRTEHRKLRDVRKEKTAAEAIREFDRDTELFGFTSGRFSLLHMIEAIVARTGPAHFSISTWTAAEFELRALEAIHHRGDITGTRWLIDFSMARREPAMTAQMREMFGWDNIRVGQVHAKFCLFQNKDWRVVLRSSMNLNMNPRCEDFQLAHDPELADFLNAILDEIFSTQPKQLADARPYDIVKATR